MEETIQYLRQHLGAKQPFTADRLEPVNEWAVAGDPACAALGRERMAQGLCGCVLVAGGQGTRLGFAGPKGLFPVTVIRGKSLFQCFCERVLAASRQVGVPLPLAIMTSRDNDRETRAFMAQHHDFGLEPGQIEYFVQGSLPMLDEEGRPFENIHGQLVIGADGNGSVFTHFVRSGIAQRWKARGICDVAFIPVDNALADPFDAELFGYHAQSHAEVTIKATWRKDPSDKEGVIVRQGGKTQIVEYSEIDQGDRERRHSDGRLVHCLANLSLFCFSLDFMQRMAQVKLPLHVHKKTAKGISGPLTAYKFEYFVFDALAYAANTGILVAPRERCFAALKNREGPHSLATVQQDLLAFDRQVYEDLTGRKPDPQALLELSPRFYYPTSKSLKNVQLPSAGYMEWPESVIS